MAVAGIARFQLGAEQVARWSAIALGFSVIVSTALNGMLMALLLVAWLASGRWDGKLSLVRTNPVAVATLGLLLVGMIGMLWSQGTSDDILLFAKKYSKLLLIPILVTVLTDSADRGRGLAAMTVGLLLTLAASYGLWVGLLPPVYPLTGTVDNPTAFKNHISHSVFMAFGVLLFLTLAWRAASSWTRWLWAGLALLGSVNVLLMVQGRTGYLVLAGIVMVALFQWLRWRGLGIAAVVVAIAFMSTFWLSPTFKHRVDLAVAQAQHWTPHQVSAPDDSIGLRLEFYTNTLTLIREHPLIGVGTAGFPAAYAKLVAGREANLARNPHNQYLLTTAELGIVGLITLLAFFYWYWRASAGLPQPRDRLLAQGLLTLMVIGCLFNSFLLDHNEGVFFCWLTGLLFAGLQPRLLHR